MLEKIGVSLIPLRHVWIKRRGSKMEHSLRVSKPISNVSKNTKNSLSKYKNISHGKSDILPKFSAILIHIRRSLDDGYVIIESDSVNGQNFLYLSKLLPRAGNQCLIYSLIRTRVVEFVVMNETISNTGSSNSYRHSSHRSQLSNSRSGQISSSISLIFDSGSIYLFPTLYLGYLRYVSQYFHLSRSVDSEFL